MKQTLIRKQALSLFAALLVIIPFVGDLTFASSNNLSKTPEAFLPVTYLSASKAPEGWLDLNYTKIDIQAGESRSEKAKREAAEAKAKLEAELAAQKRIVVARSGERAATISNLDEAIAKTHLYANQYGVDPKLMTAIISCESGYNPNAKNKNSTASGYGQFLSSTWRSTMRAMGKDVNTSPFDAETNLEATAFLLKQQGSRPWNSSAACWTKAVSR